MHGPEEAVGRGGETANSLDGLGDERCVAAGIGHVEQLNQVGNARLGVVLVIHVPERTSESIAALHEMNVQTAVAARKPALVGGDGLSGQGPAVIAVAHRQHLVRLAMVGGEQDRGVVGFCT